MRKIISGILAVLLVGCSGQRTSPTEEPTATPIPVVTEQDYEQIEEFFMEFEEGLRELKVFEFMYDNKFFLKSLVYVNVSGTDFERSKEKEFEENLAGSLISRLTDFYLPESDRDKNKEREKKINELVGQFTITVEEVEIENHEGYGDLYKVSGTVSSPNYLAKAVEMITEEFDAESFNRAEHQYRIDNPNSW